MFVKSVSCVVVSQCLSHVFSHEPRFPVFFYCPDISEHLMMEINQFVVHFFTFELIDYVRGQTLVVR
jgi:hypothetical protein